MRRGRELLLLVVSVAVALLLAELLIARLQPQWTARRLLESTPPNRRPSDILPFTMCKSCSGRLVRSEFDTRITINSLGLRGNEVDLAAPVGQRILVVGDSFTYGFGVNDHETYPAVLERRLTERLGESSVQVLNAGFASGYYPDTYYLWLKEVGLDLEPDLVLVGFFIGNDIDHDKANEHHWPKVDENGLPLKITSPGRLVSGGYQVQAVRQMRYRWPVLRNSHLYQALVTVFGEAPTESPAPKRLQQPKRPPGAPESADSPESANFSASRAASRTTTQTANKRMKLDPYFNRYMYRARYLPRTHARIAKIETLLLALVKTARERGVPVAVVMIPARAQLLPGRYGFERYPFMQDFDLDKPQRLFAEFFEREEIPYLDLLPLLRAEPQQPLIYYDRDRHLTPHGNDLVAQYLEAYLIEAALGLE